MANIHNCQWQHLNLWVDENDIVTVSLCCHLRSLCILLVISGVLCSDTILCTHAVLSLSLLQALCKVNRCLLAIDPDEQERFNVILMSHNHAHVGVRLINSINHHGKWVLPQTLIHVCTYNNWPFSYSAFRFIFRQNPSPSFKNIYLLPRNTITPLLL